MNRSKWKGPYIDQKFLKKTDTKKNRQKTLTISRNSKIIPKFLGLNFNVYNGKKYTNITVTENMIGHKFGEFSFTRANFIFKKKTKKK